MISNSLLFLSSLVLYVMAPNRWHKVFPCLILFTPLQHEIDIAFLFAAIGDFLLHDDLSLTWGVAAFSMTNLIFGTVFLQYNYLARLDPSFSLQRDIIHPVILAIWLVVCMGLYYIANDHWCLFSVYALTMTYSIFQSFRLSSSRPRKIFLFVILFLISDLMVLLTLEPQDLDWVLKTFLGCQSDLEISFSFPGPVLGSVLALGSASVLGSDNAVALLSQISFSGVLRPFDILHWLDLALYWLAMWGIHSCFR